MWEQKDWGEVRHIFDGPASVSLLRTRQGGFCSVHYHQKRYNLFRVVYGAIRVNWYAYDQAGRLFRRGGLELGPGGQYIANPNLIHNFEVLASGQVVEIYWTDDGSDAELDDIIRLLPGGMA